MFKIYDGRDFFYQWDKDRVLLVEDNTIERVNFCNRMGNCSLGMDVYNIGSSGKRAVKVPDIILQKALDLYVYAYDKNYTKYEQVFEVKPCSRPETYVYTEEEIKEWERLDERINNLEVGQVAPEAVEEAVKTVLEEMDFETGATEAQAAQIDKNRNDIADLRMASAKHQTAAQVNAAIEAAKPNLSAYALKSELPDTSSYQTAEQVNAAIVAYVGVIENGAY